MRLDFLFCEPDALPGTAFSQQLSLFSLNITSRTLIGGAPFTVLRE
jgi:hypothetical protein